MQESDMISNQPDLEFIREKHNVERERFVRGVIFAEYVVNGDSANNAYHWAFECDKREASMKSANFRNSKWVQDLIKYFRPDEDTLYFGEIRQIIRTGMAIIDNPNSEDKDKIAAMNALSKYVKVTKSKDVDGMTEVSDATKMIAGLMEGISKLVDRDKMIDRNGKIIDVPVLE